MEELDSVKIAAARYRQWAVDEFIDHGDVATLASLAPQKEDPKRGENERDLMERELGLVILSISQVLFGVTLAWCFMQLLPK